VSVARQPSFTIQIEGRERLARAFNVLPAVIQRKALRPALRAAAKVVQGEVRHTAQSMLGSGDGPPHVADSLKVRAMKRDRSKRGRIGMVVQAGRRPELAIKGRGYYPAHVEFGYLAGPRVHGPVATAHRYILNYDAASGTWRRSRLNTDYVKGSGEEFRGGQRRHVPAKPFMRTGLERARPRAMQVLADTLSANLKKMAGASDLTDEEFYADALGPDESPEVF
jgi:hypothetical protein